MSLRPVCVIGPSASGKSTLADRLLKEFNGKVALCIAYTTRKPRPNEKNGVDYNFISNEELNKLIKDDEILQKVEYCGNTYATAKKTIENINKNGQICLLLVSIEAIKNFKHLNPILIFIKPPNIEIIEKRLEERKSSNENEIKERLERTKFELDFVDKNSNLFHHIIINDNLDLAYTEFKNIFLNLI